MTVADYLDAVKERLLTDPIVVGFEIVRERSFVADGHIRARLELSDGGFLEFSEYVQRSPIGQIEVVTYSYHWADAEMNLIRRWDNTPHFPDLPGFPHHVHIGGSPGAVSGEPMDIFAVLDEIARRLHVDDSGKQTSPDG